MPVAVPKEYDQQQLDRLTGQLRLSLPERVRSALDRVIDEEFARLPPKSKSELKALVAGSVALTIRASDFNSVLESELDREHAQAETRIKATEREYFSRLIVRYEKDVRAFENVMFNRRSSVTLIESAFQIFSRQCELLAEYDEALLMDWANQVKEKALNLRRAGND